MLTVSNQNSTRRLNNSRRTADATLLPLYCEDPEHCNFNKLPPAGMFPANSNVVNSWTTAALFTPLQTFYGIELAGTVADKRQAFLNFIGIFN